MPDPTGFAWRERKDGTIEITHHGRRAALLRGARAAKFLADIASGDDQHTMARWTGSYKIGNERTARDHPRNRHRR
ncbi:hypothetical protein [Glycomyces salinus]|uniref:hypothetical protein n=1 Tax=Glycomyces salinus TaxID=980294 RepID=UPI0018ED017E|nr:hypothetical protein [Glycomyces salinus]